MISQTKQHISHFIQSITIQQCDLPPVLYFIVLYLNYQLTFQIGEQILFFLFALGLIYKFKLNMLFLLNLYTQLNWFFSIIIFIFCATSCTKKWKIYLFIISLGIKILENNNTKQPFLILASVFMCYKIINQLIFDSINQNRQFFIGYFINSAFFTIKYLNIFDKLNFLYVLFIIYSSYMISKKLIDKYILKLSQTSIQELKNSRLIAHHIKLIEQNIKYKNILELQMQNHKKQCNYHICFCHKNDKATKINQQYINLKYFQAFKILGEDIDIFLIQNYFIFLLKNEDIIKSLMKVIQIKPKSYFEYIAKIKMQGQVKEYIDEITNQLKYQKQYILAFQYDQLYSNLIANMKQILQLKVYFWGQANMINPKAYHLKSLGLKIVNKMYTTNLLFWKIRNKYQNILYIFSSTIVYSLFLLQTTSFKQYATQIIKNTLKKLNQLHTFKNSAQTYAITSFVIQNQKILDDNRLFSYSNTAKDNYQDTQFLLKQTQRSLIIDNVSLGLTKMMKKKRQQIIGQQLLSIIPTGYKIIHKIRQKQVYTFNLDYAANFQKMSPVVHKQRILPIKISDKEIIMVQVCLKYLVDIAKGLSYVSVVKNANNGSSTCIIGIDGIMYEKQNKFGNNILNNLQFKKYLNKIKQNWQNERQIIQNFDVMIDNKIYSILIESPLLNVFKDKQLIPLLHITATDQSQKNKNKQMKNMILLKKLLNKDNNKQKDTQSLQHKKQTNINYIFIIQSFAQKGISYIYIKILLLLVAILFFCFITSYFTNTQIDLTWNNQTTDFNPIFDVKYALELQRINLGIFTYVLDIFAYYQRQNQYNASRLNYYFNTTNYQQYSSQYLQKASSAVFYYYYQTWLLASAHLRKYTDALMYDSINIDGNNDMTYYEFLHNYSVDLNVLSYNIDDKSVMIFKVLDKQFIQFQNCTYLNAPMDQIIYKFIQNNINFHIPIFIVLVILLIPLKIILNNRYQFQIKILDLIATIDTKLIASQLTNLTQIINKLKFYNNIQFIFNNKSKQLDQNKTKKQYIKNKNQQNIKRQSLLQSSKDKQLNKLYISNRKRAGDLNLQNHQNNSKRLFDKMNLIFYAIVIVFICLLIVQTIHNDNYFKNIIQKKNKIFIQQDKQNLSVIYFLSFKIYLRDGYFHKQLKYLTSDALSRIQKQLNMHPLSNLPDTQEFQIRQRPCNITSISQFLPFCEDTYTYRKLQNYFYNSLKSLYQLKTNLIKKKNVSQIQYESTMVNISQSLFALQQIYNHIQGINQQFVQFYIAQFYEYSRIYQQQKQLLFYYSSGWLLLSLIICLIIINNFNKQYIQQVYMITFLNKKMINNNKKIQSFVKQIQKNNIN